MFNYWLWNQEKDAEIKQLEEEHKRMVTEIQQRHEIEMIELKEDMKQSQVKMSWVGLLKQ